MPWLDFFVVVGLLCVFALDYSFLCFPTFRCVWCVFLFSFLCWQHLLPSLIGSVCVFCHYNHVKRGTTKMENGKKMSSCRAFFEWYQSESCTSSQSMCFSLHAKKNISIQIEFGTRATDALVFLYSHNSSYQVCWKSSETVIFILYLFNFFFFLFHCALTENKNVAVSSYFAHGRNFFCRTHFHGCYFFSMSERAPVSFISDFDEVFFLLKNILYLFIEWTRWALAMINFENQVK